MHHDGGSAKASEQGPGNRYHGLLGTASTMHARDQPAAVRVLTRGLVVPFHLCFSCIVYML